MGEGTGGGVDTDVGGGTLREAVETRPLHGPISWYQEEEGTYT